MVARSGLCRTTFAGGDGRSWSSFWKWAMLGKGNILLLKRKTTLTMEAMSSSRLALRAGDGSQADWVVE